MANANHFNRGGGLLPAGGKKSRGSSRGVRKSGSRGSRRSNPRAGSGAKGEASFDPLNHYLVPKMEIMGPEELHNLLSSLRITKEDLPKMLASDPSAKALGAKPGDVIRIHRKDPTGEYFYYRLVIQE